MNNIQFFTLYTLLMSIWIVLAPEDWTRRLSIVLISAISGIVLTWLSRNKK